MAYLIGSATGSLPATAGVGVVEGGMIGLFVLYGVPAICAGIAVLAYRAVSTGLPLALGGVAFLVLGQPAGTRRKGDEPAKMLPKYERKRAGHNAAIPEFAGKG
jgi:uncharacterized protein (TIRG00374 family)